MFVLTIVLGAVLLALVVWWLAQLRGRSATEEPDETVRKAQRRRR
jgi:hypothetical protein